MNITIPDHFTWTSYTVNWAGIFAIACLTIMVTTIVLCVYFHIKK